MKTVWTIKTTWWKAEDRNAEIKADHQEALEETAFERVGSMMNQGYLEGELQDNIRMGDDDPEDGVSYTGYWKVEKSTLNIEEV